MHTINKESRAFLYNFGNTLHSEWDKSAITKLVQFPIQMKKIRM